jgi:hypothetical protein
MTESHDRTPIYRAPMRARDRELPPGAGAAHGFEHGIVGIGDPLARTPETLDQAIAAASAEHGQKAGRMLRGFARLPAGTYVWTRGPDGTFHLGRIEGPWRYDERLSARAVGICHTRSVRWLDQSIETASVPPAVSASFARGGRNLQRIHDEPAERATVELWRKRS